MTFQANILKATVACESILNTSVCSLKHLFENFTLGKNPTVATAHLILFEFNSLELSSKSNENYRASIGFPDEKFDSIRVISILNSG